MSDAKVAIATVADRRHLPAACCQLVSTANHLPSDSKTRLYLIVCDVSEDDVSNANNFFKNRGMLVDVVVPDFIEKMMTPANTKWPRATLMRLYFDSIFDDRWERIIYFDADTRVCAPLSPLITADLREKPMGAVHDYIFYVSGNIHRRRRVLFLDSDAPYFSSGVLVFDWQKMLTSDGLGATRRFLKGHNEACKAPDQDALNATFENQWAPLDPRWNMNHIYLQFGHKLRPWVMHFTSTKPWSRARTRAWREAAAWYSKELKDSPWADFVEPQTFTEALRADLRFARKCYQPHIHAALDEYARFPFSFLKKERKFAKDRNLPWVPRRAKDVEDMANALIREARGECPSLRPPEAILETGHS